MIKEILKKKPTYQTVFTIAELAQIVEATVTPEFISRVHYYVKSGELISLAKGVYVLNENYSRLEFGNKLRRPSYISLYTVLQKEGVVFQPYTSIFLITNRSETIKIANQKYVFRKIKDEILLNDLGLQNVDGVVIAVPERAVLDKIYLDGPEYFDNIRSLNLQLLKQLADEVYQHKVVSEYVDSLYKDQDAKSKKT